MFKCEICLKTFKLKTDLIRHKHRKIPCTKNKLECCYCGKLYGSRAGLSKHRKKCKIKNNTTTTNTITINNTTDNTSDNIIDNTTDNTTNNIIDNTITINNEYEYNNVIIIQDTPKQKHECDKCGKLFNSKNSMYRHRKHYCNKKDKPTKYEEILNKITDLEERLEQTNSFVERNLNSYGKEDLTWLQENFLTIIKQASDIETLDEFIKFGFQQMHCNPHRISNNNVNVPSKKDYFEQNIMSVYRDKKWELIENNKVIYNSLRRFIEMVDVQINQNIDKNNTQHTELKHSLKNLIKLVQAFDDNDDNNTIEKNIMNSVKPGIFCLVDNFKKNQQLIQ